MTLSRRATLGLLATTSVAAFVGLPAYAMEPETFQTNRIAINGVDPVAYFTDAAPVPGSPDHALEHNGATWHFVSEANKAEFMSNPDKYGARYGGYCAYAASKGGLAPTVPEAWTIHEDRLYLNFSVGVMGIWRQDIPGNIAKADANWPGILG